MFPPRALLQADRGFDGGGGLGATLDFHHGLLELVRADAWMGGCRVRNGASGEANAAKERPPLCRVGRSDEPACSRWNRCVHPHFRLPRSEVCTPRSVAIHFEVTLVQPSLRTITNKAGNSSSILSRLVNRIANRLCLTLDLRTNVREWQARRRGEQPVVKVTLHSNRRGIPPRGAGVVGRVLPVFSLLAPPSGRPRLWFSGVSVPRGTFTTGC